MSLNGVCPKLNLMALLEFELAFSYVTVKHVGNNGKGDSTGSLIYGRLYICIYIYMKGSAEKNLLADQNTLIECEVLLVV